MRLILGAVLVILAGAAGWLVATRLPAENPATLFDDTVTSSTAEAADRPIRHVAQPVRVIVAQDTPPAAPDEPVDLTEPRAAPAAPTVGPGTASGPHVDESALRYFARQGDQRRLNAEIARLKALYPDWVPPADPTAPEIFVDTELDELWQLFSEGDYGEVRSRIADRKTREPDWVPPAALTDLLDQADARIRLTNASNAKQWKTVIDTAAANPSLLTCQYVDVLWRVAEAFARTERPGRAKDAYLYILTNCDDPAERLATVQKAADLLPEDDLPDLLALDRGGEFEAVQDIILRRRVGVAAENPELISNPEDLARIEALAADSDSADDALLLGWYYYRHDEPGKALDWFGKARERDPASAKANEGYTLSLIDLKRYADAETASYDWNEKSEDNLAAYLIAAVGLLSIDPPLRISEPVLERMAEVIVRVKSLQGGEQLGWYAYNLGQVRTALRWFETVRRWDPEYEPAAYGLAVVYWALKDKARVNAIIREWGSRSERIANIGQPGRAELRGSRPIVDVVVDPPRPPRPACPPNTPMPRPTSHPGARPMSIRSRWSSAPAAGRAAAVVPARRRPGPSRRNRRCAAAGCLMDLNRPAEAAIAFDIALQSTSAKTREDAAYGATLANLRSGVTDRASVSAAAAPMSKKRQGEVTLSILSQQAVAAYADGRYVEAILALEERARLAPEQMDLMMLRGWSYFKLGRLADARRIFEAVARTGVPDGDKGLAAVAAAQAGFGGGRF